MERDETITSEESAAFAFSVSVGGPMPNSSTPAKPTAFKINSSPAAQFRIVQFSLSLSLSLKNWTAND
jgi:hypothetical protein